MKTVSKFPGINWKLRSSNKLNHTLGIYMDKTMIEQIQVFKKRIYTYFNLFCITL